MKLLPLAVALVLSSLIQPVLADTQQDEKLIDNAVGQKDYATSISIAKKLAEEGNAYGQLVLATHYSYGWGIPKNEELGTSWMRKAAQQGHKDAIMFLSIHYLLGKGGAPKHPGYERDVWIRRMANQGDLAAQRYIEENKKPSQLMNKVEPGYRSPWHDPNYAVEKD